MTASETTGNDYTDIISDIANAESTQHGNACTIKRSGQVTTIWQSDDLFIMDLMHGRARIVGALRDAGMYVAPRVYVNKIEIVH